MMMWFTGRVVCNWSENETLKLIGMLCRAGNYADI